jgi:hypothetical protein
MPHGGPHWYDNIVNPINTFLNDDNLSNLRNVLGTGGQIAVAEKAISDLQGLGADAKQFLGFPQIDPATGQEMSLYDTVASDTRFKPFSVSALPGTTQFDAQGGTTFSLSPEQQAIADRFRTGSLDTLNLVLDPEGREGSRAALQNLIEVGDTDEMGRTFRNAMEQDYIGTNRSFTDPFSADNLATAETALFDRLQEMRAPQIERDRTRLRDQLIAEGRQGLRTSQYGGTPEELALEKAIQEQQSADALTAGQQARADAATISRLRQQGVSQARIDEQLRSRQRLQAQQQFAREQALGSDIARGFLESSFRPQEALIQSTLPGLDAAALSNVAGRQLGQYGSQLGAAALDYDINAEQLATDLRREALNSLFGLLISEQNAQAANNRGDVNIELGGQPSLSTGIKILDDLARSPLITGRRLLD